PCSGNSMVEIVAQVSGSSWYRYVVSELLTIHMMSADGLYSSPATETSSGEHWASVSPGLSWDWPAAVKMMPWFQPPILNESSVVLYGRVCGLVSVHSCPV